MLEKNSKIVCVRNHTMIQKIRNKKSEIRNWHFFVVRSPHKMWHFNKLCLQHFLRMMSKMWENDGYWWFVKMLNCASKTFETLEFSGRIELFFSDNQHLVFFKTGLLELDFKEFHASAVYATPKFRHKIRNSRKSVD